MNIMASTPHRSVSRSQASSKSSQQDPSDTEASSSISSTTTAPVAAPAPAPAAAVSPDAVRVLVIGAGSRGNAYARPLHAAGAARFLAVAEPREHVRNAFGRRFIWGEHEHEYDGTSSSSLPSEEGQAFAGWEEWLAYETQRRARVQQGGEAAEAEDRRRRVNTVFVCVLDDMHLAVVKALAPLGLHVLCEKPLATTLADCLDMYAAVKAGWAKTGQMAVFGIGHVLRYSPHNVLLRKLVREEKAIGEILSIEHTEPVGWWHFTHSYVRGNWRREDTSAPSLLAKSCHDIDFLLWLLSSPTTSTANSIEPPHLPSSITSTGSLRLFRKARKPLAAGNATNCLTCAHERDCSFSAKNVYITKHLRQGNTGWPVKILVPEIEDLMKNKGSEAAETRLLDILKDDYDETTSAEDVAARTWYGRCVYEGDNDVCDDQTVTIEWQDEPSSSKQAVEQGNLGNRGAKTAIFHMVAFSEAVCARRGRIYGTAGEISYNSNDISVYNFHSGETKHYHISAPIEDGHGGGDQALAMNMARAVTAAEQKQMTVNDAQWRYLGVDLEEVVRSHAAVFAAEEARTQNRIIDWSEWWSRKVETRLNDHNSARAPTAIT